MRKIFPFEISMATKDRSSTFQFVTLALFSFCLAVIVFASLQRLGLRQKTQQDVVKGFSSVHYAGVISTGKLSGIKR